MGNRASYSLTIGDDLGLPAVSAIEALELRVALSPEAPFVTLAGQTTTFAGFQTRTEALSVGLRRNGVRHGDFVAVALRNSLDQIAVVFALARLGAVPVLINPDFRGAMLRHVLVDSGSTVIVAEAELVGGVAAEFSQAPKLKTLIVRGDTSVDVEHVTFSSLALEGSPARPAVELRHKDPFVVLYTSGTTGPSKGVVISHGQALTWASDWGHLMEFGPEDVLFSPLPLFHGIGFLLGLLPTLVFGAHMYIEEKFSASRFWDSVRNSRATIAHTIFSIIPILLNAPPNPGRDRDHQLRAVYVGPSKLSPAFEARFGVPVVEVFGQTETGIITSAPIGALRPGSCGQINHRRFEVAILDSDDNPLPSGATGEIAVRPRQAWSMMTGYLNRPEATEQAFRNLWYHTGDLGHLDEEGWLYFADRAKDAIRRRGENISSYEVETIAGGYADVLEIAAIPVPSELAEDEVKVCIVPVDRSSFDYTSFAAYCESEMPSFMVPRYVELLDALPKTSTEKILKSDLRSAGRFGLTRATWDRTTGRTLGQPD